MNSESIVGIAIEYRTRVDDQERSTIKTPVEVITTATWTKMVCLVTIKHVLGLMKSALEMS